MTPIESTASLLEHRRQIVDEIEHLRRELAARRAISRRASRSIVLAYHELLERQYLRLDGLASD
jgi:hypothetical protein